MLTHQPIDPNRARLRMILCSVFVILIASLAACSKEAEPASSAADTTANAEQSTATPESTAAEASTPAADTADAANNDAAAASETQAGDAAGGAADNAAAENAGQLEPAQRADMYTEPPDMTIDPQKYYYATIQTDKGDIKVQLFADRAPVTVNNFVFLARQGFYDNTTFHRVLDGFMAQGGDPTGTGMGGPGYRFQDEFFPGLTFDRPGLLAMANSGPATNGSQFFITFAPTEWLNNMHTIFGEVIEGQEVLDNLTRRDPQQNPDFPGDTIQTITIEETDSSILPTPTPLPPTPTPYPPTSMEDGERPLARITAAERANYFNTPPEVVIDASQPYTALISTSRGDMTASLFAADAPIAVNNFVVLSNLGFYDDSPVNAVNPGQALVFGAPDNTPLNDVGYQFDAEKVTDRPPALGSLAYIPMRTSTGAVQSSGSQVLIALIDPPPAAANEWSFFGQVTDGIDILQSLTVSDTINSITITPTLTLNNAAGE